MKLELMKTVSGSGLKLTPQRMAILGCLEGNTCHPSAEEIFRQVSQAYPMMSFATVYNTLSMLRDRGLVLELTIDPARKRYDPNVTPHHHVICLACGKIADVHAEYELAVPADIADAFVMSGNHVEFYGTCSACGNAAQLKGE